MWLQLDNQQLDLLESALSYRASEIRKGLSELKPEATGPRERLTEKAAKHDALLELVREKRVIGEHDDAYRNTAINRYYDEGRIEIDDDAIISEGSDPGAYVMGWLWVEASLAGVPVDDDDDDDKCRTCGEHYEDGGDGFDGECPDCTDKTDQKLNPENYL